MTDHANEDPSTWDPALDAVVAAPKHHKVLFENDQLRVLEVTLEHDDEEPLHHHRWASVFVFDQVQGPVHQIAPDGTLIDFCDRFGVVTCEWDRPLSFEAAWDVEGAVCVARPRIADLVSLEGLAERYPKLRSRLGPMACTREGAEGNSEVLLFNRS